MDPDDLHAWIGKTEQTEDYIDPRRCAQLAGALGLESTPLLAEDLPLPWHWTFFNPVTNARATGADGHPARGTFLPPVTLPRRMWAGSRVSVERALVIGEKAWKESRIAAVQEKEGKQGRLVFVTVEHTYCKETGETALREEQDIVYRDRPSGTAAKAPPHQPEVASQWSEEIVPDPVLLFRYSALTYNAHRIHYDRAWAVGEEGYPGLVVQGPLTATLLLNSLYRRFPHRRIEQFSFRGVSPLFDLAPFQLHGGIQNGRAVLWAVTLDQRLALSMNCRLDTS